MTRSEGPALSVLLPCRNAAATLRQCTDSLSTQSFDDFEVIAIDDGSDDDTLAILKSVSSADARFRVFARSFRGIAANLIEATDLSRAPLIARMDADDRCEPDRFMAQVECLQKNPELSVVGAQIRFFPRQGLRQGSLRYESWLNGLLTHEQMRRDLFVESPLAHPSVMMRTSTLARLGGYRDRGWPEDYDLWLRLFLEGHRAHKVARVLLHWRDAPQRASRVDRRYSQENFFAAKLYYLTRSVIVPGRALVIWGAGRIGKQWLVELLARGHRVDCVVELNPRKIGKRIHGTRVVGPSEIPAPGEAMVLVAVGALSRSRGASGRSEWFSAREEIREELVARGYVEGDDFVCVA